MLKSFYIISLNKQLPNRLLLKLLFSITFVIFSNIAFAAEDDKVSLNFVNADLGSVIKAISQITGKNFIIDPRVRGAINIVSSSPIPPAMTYQVLLSALRTQGFAATENNGVTTILPEVDAKLRFSPTVTGGNKIGGDQIITQVFTIKYESVNSLVAVLKPYISPSNVINAYPSTNMLIITDYAENLKKLAKLISTIDQPTTQENVVISVKYANAVELAQTLNKLSDLPIASTETSRKMLVVADPRSNTIILKSDNPVQVNRIKQLIQQLDTQATAGNNIHVVYLRNADAKKLAVTLQALTSSSSDTFSKSNMSNENVKTNSLASGNNTSAINPSVNIPFAPIATLEPTFSGNMSMVQADTATNSLIITAPDHVFNMLRNVIDKLDVRRAQLYIEALIAEVSTDKTSEFGIQWQNISNLSPGSNNIRAFGGTKFDGSGTNILSVAQNVGSASNGLNVGILKGQVTIPGLGTITNLGVLAHALESDVNANILSKPNLLTLDNEEAKIVIGQNVPFITGQYAQSVNGGINPFQTVERQDVGLTLKVKPQISESDTIKLQIYQEVSSVVDAVNSAGITTNKRSIDTSVLIDDGNIIVLGGLIEDRIAESVDSVPILGDIPLIGNLFKSQGRSHKKTNLMVFLRPYVIRDNQSSQNITNERYEYIRNQEQLIRPKPNWILPDVPEIEMPKLRE
jgi:general secretion pathway protein D